MRTEPSNWDDLIDSRDVDIRIGEIECATGEHADHEKHPTGTCAACDPELQDELRSLNDLRQEALNVTDTWENGATLIRDSHFEDYARCLAEETGAIGRETGWPLDYIDWTRAASALQMDYSSVTYDGVTYWVR